MRLLAVALGCMLVAAPLAAQRRSTTLSIGYTDTNYESDSREHYNGLTLGIAIPLGIPLDIGLRGHYGVANSDAKIAADLLLQGNLPLGPVELTGLAGITTWYPDYTGEASDEGLTPISTAVGLQVRLWVVDRLGVMWEGMKRGLLDRADQRSGHLTFGLIGRL